MWQKLLLYSAFGAIGLLIEVVFTGARSLIQKNWKATSVTYLWMWPIYSAAGAIMQALSQSLAWPFWAKAFIYMPVIYGVEALSGWILSKVIGSVPWHYGLSHWTPMGLINLKYAPYWFALALCFD